MSKLLLTYNKRQKDFVVKFPNSRDGGLAMHHLVGPILRWRSASPGFEAYNFIEDLEARGQDLDVHGLWTVSCIAGR